jgi:hypothetical protein
MGEIMKRKLVIGLGVIFCLLALFIVGMAISTWMIQNRVPVSIVNSLSVHGNADYAIATGTMVIEGERSATPLQTSEIKCDARNKQCVVATAIITPTKGLYVMVDSYPTIEWTDSHLIFGEEAACVTNTYTINWVSKSVTGIRTRNKNPTPGVDCSAILFDELRVSLRDGFEVSQEEERRAWPTFIRITYALMG